MSMQQSPGYWNEMAQVMQFPLSQETLYLLGDALLRKREDKPHAWPNGIGVLEEDFLDFSYRLLGCTLT